MNGGRTSEYGTCVSSGNVSPVKMRRLSHSSRRWRWVSSVTLTMSLELDDEATEMPDVERFVVHGVMVAWRKAHPSSLEQVRDLNVHELTADAAEAVPCSSRIGARAIGVATVAPQIDFTPIPVVPNEAPSIAVPEPREPVHAHRHSVRIPTARTIPRGVERCEHPMHDIVGAHGFRGFPPVRRAAPHPTHRGSREGSPTAPLRSRRTRGPAPCPRRTQPRRARRTR